MKQSTLNEIIQAECRRTLPACPGNLESNVLRRIRLSHNETPFATGGVPQRMPALFALTLVGVLLSTSIALGLSGAQLKSAEKREVALQALDFGLLNDPGLQVASLNRNRNRK